MNPEHNSHLAHAITNNQDMIEFEEMLRNAWVFAREAKLPVGLCVSIASMHTLQVQLNVIANVGGDET